MIFRVSLISIVHCFAFRWFESKQAATCPSVHHIQYIGGGGSIFARERKRERERGGLDKFTTSRSRISGCLILLLCRWSPVSPFVAPLVVVVVDSIANWERDLHQGIVDQAAWCLEGCRYSMRRQEVTLWGAHLEERVNDVNEADLLLGQWSYWILNTIGRRWPPTTLETINSNKHKASSTCRHTVPAIPLDRNEVTSAQSNDITWEVTLCSILSWMPIIPFKMNSLSPSHNYVFP